MTLNQYVVGEVVFLQDVITDQSTGLPATDGSDAVTVYAPDGTQSTPSVTPGSAGTYSAAFTPSVPGWHQYVFRSTGGGAGAGRGRFWVSPTP